MLVTAAAAVTSQPVTVTTEGDGDVEPARAGVKRHISTRCPAL